MNHKKELISAIVCTILIGVLLFIIGMRAGQHDAEILAEEKYAAIVEEIERGYKAQIEQIGLEVAKAREEERIVYEYRPLPVDYENIGDIQPEEDDVIILAKALFMEAGVGNTDSQIFATADCPLNRVEAGYGTLRDVITAEGQFVGYSPNHPVDERMYLYAKDAIMRHKLIAWEKATFGYTFVSTTIPSEYLYFAGDGLKNTFTDGRGNRVTP